MAEDIQKLLDAILDDLRSGSPARQLGAIQALDRVNDSSQLIFLELQRLAIYGPEEVRMPALEALRSKPSQYVASQLSRISKYDRATVLKEIEAWKAYGLVDAQQAEALSKRYDFEQRPRPSARPVAAKPSEPSADVPVKAVPAGPRPSLIQTLLSEASIRIYLYLGAFFVIASALILAAVVEAARLPILAVATLAFGGVALGLRKRLPQPSFAFFIVFSFLLPIDANVLKESLGLVEPVRSVFWMVVFLLLAAIWSFSVWFYQSRFFSAVAFGALSLAFYRAAATFGVEAELQIFFVLLASLAGLAGTFVLRKWKDSQFAFFVFWLAQLQVLGVLFTSLFFVEIHLFGPDLSVSWWLLIALTWLTAASFYVWSDLLTPTFIFPWMAVGALLPLPWFVLQGFEVSPAAYAFGFFLAGAIAAVVSEIVQRVRTAIEKVDRYHWAFLAGSVVSFLTAFAVVLIWDRPFLTFGIFALTTLVYAALHIARPRWYVWSTGLICAVLAYFTFFTLPVVVRLDVPMVYQVLIGSILLVLPELFARSPLSISTQSRWPAMLLGSLFAAVGITLALMDLDHTGRSGLVLFVYAILITLHALHGKRPWLGYAAATLESLALVYALDHFSLDLWLPALTLLSVIYYAAGFFFRRRGNELKAWGEMLVNSSLGLGALLSLAALVLFKEANGWYILLLALLFAVEVFARPLPWLELGVEILLSISLYLILNGLEMNGLGHFLFAASLVWLGGDILFGRLIQAKRSHRPITRGAGYVLVALSTLSIWGIFGPWMATFYFILYAVFFAAYAYLQKEPWLGYLVTSFLALVVMKLCEGIRYETWIFPLIALAVAYYLAGLWFRRNQTAQQWDEVLLYSGLGLGVLTSLSALLFDGPAISIPVAITATLFAAEAFARRNVWWALPADLFYLISYFMILWELKVDQPQYYSMGAALLGLAMHYLLTRAGSQTGTFIAGMLSQLVLLGTTYIQMVSTEKLSFFVVLFVQSLTVLIYGLTQRSRSLVITPLVFAVLGVMTVIYSALKGLGPVILIGSTGVLLLGAGIVAVLLRERITRLGEQLSEWKP